MIYALVCAGGVSERMGRPKLALPLGDRTVIEHVVAALRAARIEQALVVLGPQVTELQPLAEAAGAKVLLLPEQTPDMRATIQHGLWWLEEKLRPGEKDAWLLVPADQPTLGPQVVRQLLAAGDQHEEQSIFIPTYRSRRGHPTLIGWRHVPAIRALRGDQGLNIYLRAQTEQTLEVPVDSPEVLIDLDTPEDYQRLLCSWTTAR